MGDLGEVGVEGFDAELGFQEKGDEVDGGKGKGLGFSEREPGSHVVHH